MIRKTLENEILKKSVDFAKAKKVNYALASIGWGRSVRAVCCALAISCSHVFAKKLPLSYWAERIGSPPRTDDAQVKQAIAD